MLTRRSRRVDTTSRRVRSYQRGQSIAEFALLAPVILLILALIFTGSQYMDAVVGLNGAARAGTVIASNYLSDSQNPPNLVLTAAVAAVNNEWGASCSGAPCFTGVSNQSSCAPTAATPGCVWLDTAQAPSTRTVEMVHVSYKVNSYLTFIPGLSVTATAGAEYG